jgi:NAD(P)-dependent dehydrogenase (short-subunit alcohol dehydrogenase family)
MNLKDKIIVITGASKGFGKSFAKFFIAENSKVIISSNDADELKKAADELSCDYFVANVTKPEEINELAKYTVGKFGRIDIWINNAGIQIAPSLVEDVNLDKFKKLFDINFFGYFYGCQVALKQFRKQGDGLIINISSTAGLDGKPMLSAYCSSKFAIKGLTESIRQEIKNTNIKARLVFPGGMQTDIYHEQIPADIHQYMQVDEVVKKVIDNLKSDQPDENFIIRRPQR